MSEIPAELSDDATGSTDSDDVGGLYRRAMELIRTEFEEQTWRAFLRVTVEGQSPRDVAVDLGMTPNAVYIAKSRVLCRLREELGD
jgi:RNA polymerase sigma-70 factor (ECF subfamily)